MVVIDRATGQPVPPDADTRRHDLCIFCLPCLQGGFAVPMVAALARPAAPAEAAEAAPLLPERPSHRPARPALFPPDGSDGWLSVSADRSFILTPENGALQIDVRGDLAGILAVSLKSKRPAGGAGRSQVEMVAGTVIGQNLGASQTDVVAGGRNRQDLRTQKSRPVGAADVRDLVLQFELVAGAGFEPAAFRL